MRHRIPIILAYLLIIFLSFYYGGVTPEGRLIAIAGGLVIFILALTVITVSSSYPLSWNPLFLLPLTLILIGGLVSRASPAPAMGRIEFWEILSCSLLMAAIILSRPGDRALLYYYLFLLLWGGTLTVYGISELDWNLFKIGPLTSTYINRNHFSAFIGLIIPLSISFGLGSSKRAVALFSGVGFLILLSGIILTRSRGGLLAASVSSLTVLLIYILKIAKNHSRKKKNRVLLLFICGLLIILVSTSIYFHSQSGSSYSTSLDTLSIQTRFSIWKSTLDMFLARPWLGWGWGTFRYVYPQFKDPRVWYSVPHAHNELLQILGEGGALGFIAILLCLVWSLSRLLKTGFSSPTSVVRLFSLGAAGSLVYSLVHGGFDFILRLPANTYLLTAIVSLGLASSRFKRRPGGEISGRAAKLAFTLPVIFILCFFVLYPIGRFSGAYFQWKKGEELLAIGNPEAAREHFSRASELDPHDNRPLYGSASVQMNLFERSPDKIRLYRSILADLRKARRNNPWDLQPLWVLARFHQRLSANEKAEAYLKEALSLDPTSPFVLRALAKIELNRGEYASAVLRLHQASAIYTCAWPSCLSLLLKYTEDYNILKELPPPEDGYHRDLGYHLLGKKKWQEAEGEFKKSLVLEPDNPKNWRAMGRFHSITQNLTESRKCYEKALAISPENAQWWSELGDIFKKREMKESALDCYLLAHTLAPKNILYPRKAAPIIFQLKGRDAALTFWEGVTDKNPLWSWPYYLRAKFYLESGDITRARREIELALQRSPKHSYYLNLKNRIDSLLQNPGIVD